MYSLLSLLLIYFYLPVNFISKLFCNIQLYSSTYFGKKSVELLELQPCTNPKIHSVIFAGDMKQCDSFWEILTSQTLKLYLVFVILSLFCLPMQFAVLRFFETDDDDSQYFEVGWKDWIVSDLDDDLKGETKWPPKSKPATPLIKVQAPFDPLWETHCIQVMRFYGK